MSGPRVLLQLWSVVMSMAHASTGIMKYWSSTHPFLPLCTTAGELEIILRGELAPTLGKDRPTPHLGSTLEVDFRWGCRWDNPECRRTGELTLLHLVCHGVTWVKTRYSSHDTEGNKHGRASHETHQLQHTREWSGLSTLSEQHN